MKRLTVPALRKRKKDGATADPLVVLTAYTARQAQLLDAHCDLLLVGDSLGQVIYGLPSTVPVTLEMMANHAAAVERGIPVIGHVGLTPQAVNVLGGYGARGKSDAEADKIVADAKALDDAGAFAIVVEGVLEPIAEAVTAAVACPTIGIGASAQCDGQVLVTEDMLGMFERVPRFVKRYEDLAGKALRRGRDRSGEVRDRSFPGPEQTYRAD